VYQLFFYVPESHKEAVKNACFAAGAGAISAYTRCAWEVRGTGQFLPGDGSTPFLGRPGELEQEGEYKVEMVLEEELKEPVTAALTAAHPYETPAWGLIQLVREPEKS
jgi:hypothetical protein